VQKARFLSILAVWYCAGFWVVTAAWGVVSSNHFRVLVLFVAALVSLIPFLIGLAGVKPVDRSVAVLTAALGGIIALGFIVFPYLVNEIWPKPSKLSKEEFYISILGLLFLVVGPLFAGWFLSKKLAHSNGLPHANSRDAGASEQRR
jgi:hypothetical protein